MADLDNWIKEHVDFINEEFREDLQGGRALGPASGVLWDAYPFLHWCQYSGLFAGLSLSGLLSTDIDVRITEYSSKWGFKPATAGDFGGTKWQELSGSDWEDIDPNLCTSYRNDIKPPGAGHDLDVTLSIGGTTISTRGWEYAALELSNKYRQHSWRGGGYYLVAVTFKDRPSRTAPFLRPCYVDGASAQIDPHCLYTASESVRLCLRNGVIDGRVLLRSDEDATPTTSLSVRDTAITIKKEPTLAADRILRKISGIGPNVAGNFSCTSSGCCRFHYEFDKEGEHSVSWQLDATTLKPMKARIGVQNACSPCCHCGDYVEYYDRLRPLFASCEALVKEFNRLYGESLELKEEVKQRVQQQLALVKIHLGTWGWDDNAQFYCDFFVTVSVPPGTKTVPTSVSVSFRNGKAALSVNAVEVLGSSDILPMTAVKSGTGVQLTGIGTTFIGAKTRWLRVWFAELSSIPSPASAIKADITHG